MNSKIRLVISAGLLGWIAWQTNWTRVGQAFANLHVEYWLAAVGLLLATQIVSCIRWRYLAKPLGFDPSLKQIAGYYFIGMFFNLFLPTSVGGDVIRAWYLDGQSGKKLRAFMSVFLDRITGLWMLLALALVSVSLSPLELPGWMVWSVYGCAGGGVLAILLLPPLVRYSHLAPWKLRQAFEALKSLPSLQFLIWPLILSVVVQAANVIIVWWIGMAIDAPIPATFYWILVPMVSLLTLLPVSVNGMGVREGAMAVMLAPLGVGQETALTLAFLWFAVSATVSLFGGAVYLWGSFPRPVFPTSTVDKGGESNGSVSSDSDQGRTGQLKAAA